MYPVFITVPMYISLQMQGLISIIQYISWTFKSIITYDLYLKQRG